MVPFSMFLSQLLLAVFMVSAGCAGALVLAQRWHIGLTGDAASEAHHKVHAGTVPRVGGVAVYAAGVTGLALLSPTLPDITAKIIWMLWGCLTIVFVTGLIEDMTRAVPASVRYIAALAAALLFSVAHGGYGISSVGISPIDLTLNMSWVRIGFFAFAVASLAHSFNLVDGQNGLCSGLSILVFIAVGFTAQRTEQLPVATLCFVMAAANLGFLIFNFPLGKLFLGDGGAYFNGAVAAVTTVLVVQGSSAVSPWLAILILIYPVWETLFSIGRRLNAGRPFYEADNRHLHHLAARALSARAGGIKGLSTLPILACAAPFMAVAPFTHDRPVMLIFLAIVFVSLYVVVYAMLSQGFPATPQHGARS
ncbi:MAG: undecaprenyl/decaprenyl-phosphate alpha-N-acetylglucosaminyl 1-phosphate transferase [Pseudomonadota bacterium]|nr:undecaprenyl/decaprenyl-phosphate alpha-N-acetylglucosaminyl 1-phosphate transferase [Pseudomonadota bacterium]